MIKDLWRILKQTTAGDWVGCISIFVTFFIVLTWVGIGVGQ